MAVVIVDSDSDRAASIPRELLQICGDASDDDVLRRAGIDRSAALVSAEASRFAAAADLH